MITRPVRKPSSFKSANPDNYQMTDFRNIFSQSKQVITSHITPIQSFFSQLKKHLVKETFTTEIWYPDHPPRTESALFRKSRKQMIDDGKQGCWVCGTRKDLELHHFIIEWAASESIDFGKMKKEYPTFDWKNFKEPSDFIDSTFNMRVLCAIHHRHPLHGIHCLPFPLWQLQKFVKDSFQLIPK